MRIPPVPAKTLLPRPTFFENLNKRGPPLSSSGTRMFLCRWLESGPLGQIPGRNTMSEQVILYFDDEADALHFALAAGSVMAGDGPPSTEDLIHQTARATRIRLEDANVEPGKQPCPPERAA
jgi:hypothetical protein